MFQGMSQKKSYSGLNQLIVYKKSVAMSLVVFQHFKDKEVPKSYDFLINQLYRSVSSVPANIAEGYGRFYAGSYKNHLSIARGSCYEIKYWLVLCHKLSLIDRNLYENINNKNTEIIKMLSTLIKKINTNKDRD